MKIFCAIKRRKNYGNILKKENVIKAGLTDEQKPKTRLLQEVLSLWKAEQPFSIFELVDCLRGGPIVVFCFINIVFILDCSLSKVLHIMAENKNTPRELGFKHVNRKVICQYLRQTLYWNKAMANKNSYSTNYNIK